MKICVVNHLYKYGVNKGGGSVSANVLADALERIGHEVIKVSSSKEIKKNSDVVLHLNIKGIVQTQKTCKKLNLPLVVTINSNITCCTGAHITNESKYGVPCTSCSLLETFKCLFWNKRNQARSGNWRVRMRNLSFLATPIYFKLREMRINALNRVDRIVCVSPTLKEMLTISGVHVRKEVIIPPVDPSFLEDPKVKMFDEKVALFVGSGSWIKGAHLAAEAISKLNEIKLVFVGRVGEKMKKIIKYFLGNRAIFCGTVPYSEIKKYYYSSHIVMFPSIWFEPHGRIWTEACMCGTPVVAFNNRGGASDFLVHEKTALLSNYDVDEYAEQIRRLFEDEDLHRRISRNAREYAKKNFLAEVVAKKYEKVFEEVLKKGI